MKAIKKLAEIECMRLTSDNVGEVMRWCPACEPRYMMYEEYYLNSCQCQHRRIFKELVIHTLNGDHIANVGDYIIKGAQGEFYPCKPDVFEKTYDIIGE